MGDNGTGKTTLLIFLAGFALQRRTDSEYCEPVSLHHAFYLNNYDNYLAKIVYESAKNSEGERSILYATVGRNSRLNVAISSGAVPAEMSDYLFIVAYGASRRLSGTDMKPSEASDPTATLFDPNAGLLNAEELLLRLDYRALQGQRRGRAQERLEQVTAMICDLLPDVSRVVIQPDDENGSIRSGLEDSIRFQTPYGEVPLRGLSLGYQTMIAWTVDLASRMLDRYPSSPNPLHEPAVVLVDELDLHLHPRWQRQILDFLSQRFPNVQFIATAHSPLVVQAAGEAGVNLVVLRREGDHVVIDNNPQVVTDHAECATMARVVLGVTGRG